MNKPGISHTKNKSKDMHTMVKLYIIQNKRSSDWLEILPTWRVCKKLINLRKSKGVIFVHAYPNAKYSRQDWNKFNIEYLKVQRGGCKLWMSSHILPKICVKGLILRLVLLFVSSLLESLFNLNVKGLDSILSLK